MTTEEKAKAYDDVVKKAREYYNSPRTCFDIDFLQDIFPELKESEGEKIRKEIITYLYNELHNIKQLTPRTNQIESWVTYLEKQKEQLLA